MKKRYLIVFSLLFIGCTEKTTSFTEINQKKIYSTQAILTQFKNIVTSDNPEYQDKIKLVESILYKVNTHLYGNPYEVKARFVNTKYGMATALADDTILITTYFLDAVIDHFTKDEVSAIICHESVHILNDDWGESFRDNSIYLNYKIENKIDSPNFLGVVTGYGLTKLLYSNKRKMSFKDYLKEYSPSKISSFENQDTWKKGEYSFNLLSLQGFSVETEMNTDKEALNCLEALNIDSNNMINVLKKIYVLENKLNNQLKHRITKLEESK